MSDNIPWINQGQYLSPTNTFSSFSAASSPQGWACGPPQSFGTSQSYRIPGASLCSTPPLPPPSNFPYPTDLGSVNGIGSKSEEALERGGIYDVGPLMAMFRRTDTAQGFRAELRAVDPKFPFQHNMIRRDIANRVALDDLLHARYLSPPLRDAAIGYAIDDLARGVNGVLIRN